MNILLLMEYEIYNDEYSDKVLNCVTFMEDFLKVFTQEHISDDDKIQYSIAYLYQDNQISQEYEKLNGADIKNERNRVTELIKKFNYDVLICCGDWIYTVLIGKGGGVKHRKQEFQVNYKKTYFTYSPVSLNNNLQYIEYFFEDLCLIINQKFNKEKLKNKRHVILKTKDEIISFLSFVEESADLISIDIETNSLNPFHPDSKIIAVAIGIEPYTAFAFPLLHRNSGLSELDIHEICTILKRILENPKIDKIGHNVKFDFKFIEYYLKCTVKGFIHDTMIYQRITNDSLQATLLSLKSLAWIYTPYGGYEIQLKKIIDANFKERVTQLGIDDLYVNYEIDVSMDKLLEYCCIDADVTYIAYEILIEKVKRLGLDKLYKTIIEPCYKAFIKAEQNGFIFDTNKCGELKDNTEIIIKSLELKIHNDGNVIESLKAVRKEKFNKLYEKRLKEISEFKTEVRKERALLIANDWVGEKIQKEIPEFNINSRIHLKGLIYDTLKIVPTVFTKSHFPSTNNLVIKKYGNEFPIISDISEYRLINKIYTGYLLPFSQGKRITNGVYYPEFNFSMTKTGRLSSGIHTMPKSKRCDVKTLFTSGLNRKIIQADYKAAELRILASLSKEPSWCKLFNENITKPEGQQLDLHIYTASLIYNCNYKLVTEDQRQSAKAINFGIAYGMSSFGLSKRLNISEADAKEFIEQYFAAVPKVKEYIEHNIKICRKQGYIKNPFGRIRTLININSKDHGLRSTCERQCTNAVVQSATCDYCKIAFTNIHNFINENNLQTKLLASVHDSIIASVPFNEIDIYLSNIKPLMTGTKFNWLIVPMDIDIKISNNWFGKDDVDEIVEYTDEEVGE